jgi:hypothetical protein
VDRERGDKLYTHIQADQRSDFRLKIIESKYRGPEDPALVAPKGLLFNSHWHVAEHPEIGPKEFELSFQTPGIVGCLFLDTSFGQAKEVCHAASKGNSDGQLSDDNSKQVFVYRKNQKAIAG